MRIGIIGSGSVAQDLGRGFAKRGDEVKLGSRSPEKLDDWVAEVEEPPSLVRGREPGLVHGLG